MKYLVIDNQPTIVQSDVLFIVFITILFLILINLIINQIIKEFIKKYSISYNELIKINKDYNFYDIKDISLTHYYDNHKYYATVSCEDYLIYYLNEKYIDLQKTIDYANVNYKIYPDYKEKIDNIVKHNFDYDKNILFKKYVFKIEDKLFNKTIKHPKFSFIISINLHNDYQKHHHVKHDEYSFNEIQTLHKSIKRNYYGHYPDEIWQSLVNVERAKVTNKLRFAIFERDHYTCQMCKRTLPYQELEIDHIYPISKGGKSIYSNLQTLCKSCNKSKGNNIIYKHK